MGAGGRRSGTAGAWALWRFCFGIAARRAEHVGIGGRDQIGVMNPEPPHQAGGDDLTFGRRLIRTQYHLQFEEVAQPCH